MKKNKYKLIAAAIVAVILAIAFMWNTGSVPDKTEKAQTPKEVSSALTQLSAAPSSGVACDDTEKITATEKSEDTKAPDDTSPAAQSDASSAPPAAPPPAEAAEDGGESDGKLTCTLSVRCDTILDNLEKLDSQKVGLIPKDGIIFAEKAVRFYDGESVFDVLVREMKQHKIHLEFENTPIYDSAYIEGIANIYEFDCGGHSGWKYKVNGQFAGYGCSQYILKAGDRIEWVYTLN